MDEYEHDALPSRGMPIPRPGGCQSYGGVVHNPVCLSGPSAISSESYSIRVA